MLQIYGNGFLNSYSQVFFSNNKTLAILLFLVTFLNPVSGLSGAIAIIIGQILARGFNFSQVLISDGTYTYNSLMVGVGMGVIYDPSMAYLVVLIVFSIITFFLSVWLSHFFSLKKLPFLSIPFLLAMWLVLLGGDSFSSLQLSSRQIWFLGFNSTGLINQVAEFVGTLPFPDVLHLYLRSLGAILFQYNDLAGIIIVIAILISSRMALVLSFFGFLIGYLFYLNFEGDFSQLVYSYIGFNFILTGIALGGFFIVPSRKSYLLLIVVIPVIAFLISGFYSLFTVFQLPLYSLPFNIVVLLVLYTFGLRTSSKGLNLVTLQQFSPEKNYYKHLLGKMRFGTETYYHLSLPVLGEWYISQGANGKITHKGEWKEALDFDIRDDSGKTFRGSGAELSDYYCYDIPVVAPAHGTIIKIDDGIEDNVVGNVNLEYNWGNTVIIKHGEGFFTKLSHLKKGSIKYNEGDFVQQGDILAHCGSSGRSPEPHLHFQVQTQPYIGAPTLKYPIAYYLVKEKNTFAMKEFAYPKEGETIRNVEVNSLLKKAYNFIPGQSINVSVAKSGEKPTEEVWKVNTNLYNQSYFYSPENGARAYFINRGQVFLFTDYSGKTNTALYAFYICSQKILLGSYKDVELNDQLPVSPFFNKLLLLLQDFAAPFYQFLGVNFHSKIVFIDNDHSPREIQIETGEEAIAGKRILNLRKGKITIGKKGIKSFEITNPRKKTTLSCAFRF